jgi:excisionase family DNA binding protein
MDQARGYMKPATCAQELGCSTGWIYQLVKNGQLTSVRIGKAVFVPRVAWETFLAQHTHAAATRSQDSPVSVGAR